MLTTGGLLHAAADDEAVTDCRLGDSPYAVLAGEEPYEIVVPNLTTREMQHLSQKMPRTGTPRFEGIGVSEKRHARIETRRRTSRCTVDIDLV